MTQAYPLASVGIRWYPLYIRCNGHKTSVVVAPPLRGSTELLFTRNLPYPLVLTPDVFGRLFDRKTRGSNGLTGGAKSYFRFPLWENLADLVKNSVLSRLLSLKEAKSAN
jgi:hypothetical protein